MGRDGGGGGGSVSDGLRGSTSRGHSGACHHRCNVLLLLFSLRKAAYQAMINILRGQGVVVHLYCNKPAVVLCYVRPEGFIACDCDVLVDRGALPEFSFFVGEGRREDFNG